MDPASLARIRGFLELIWWGSLEGGRGSAPGRRPRSAARIAASGVSMGDRYLIGKLAD